MPDNHKLDWSPPADMAMDIIAMCDGSIEKACAYVVELQVFLKELSPENPSVLQARRLGCQRFFDKIFKINKPARKKPKKQDCYMFDTGSGLVRILDHDDDFETVLSQNHRRGKRKLAS